MPRLPWDHKKHPTREPDRVGLDEVMDVLVGPAGPGRPFPSAAERVQCLVGLQQRTRELIEDIMSSSRSTAESTDELLKSIRFATQHAEHVRLELGMAISEARRIVEMDVDPDPNGGREGTP